MLAWLRPARWPGASAYMRGRHGKHLPQVFDCGLDRAGSSRCPWPDSVNLVPEKTDRTPIRQYGLHRARAQLFGRTEIRQQSDSESADDRRAQHLAVVGFKW